MNSPGGGKLLVGVDDKGAICGIQRDFETFNKKNCDGWLQHFTSSKESHFLYKQLLTLIAFYE
jgi:hypothetical protein